MVRKPEESGIMSSKLEQLLNETGILRERNADFIAVSNSEWYSLFQDEIRNSIAIEGVFANRNELLDVLERHKRTNKHKTASILGYFESAGAMYGYAHNQFKEKEFVLRMADIKQIHTLLMRYEKDFGFYIGPLGDFRKGDVEVANATFKSINAFYIKDAVKALIAWFNSRASAKDCDPIKLAAITHTWFETIHPFADGNGRSGRILLSYILIGLGLVNISIKGIGKPDRQKYYEALEFSDDCFETLDKEIESGKRISREYIERAIKATDYTPLESLIMDCLEKAVSRLRTGKGGAYDSDAVVPLRKLAEAYGYSQDYLRNLINRGNLAASKRGKLWYVRIRDMQKYVDKE